MFSPEAKFALKIVFVLVAAYSTLLTNMQAAQFLLPVVLIVGGIYLFIEFLNMFHDIYKEEMAEDDD